MDERFAELESKNDENKTSITSELYWLRCRHGLIHRSKISDGSLQRKLRSWGVSFITCSENSKHVQQDMIEIHSTSTQAEMPTSEELITAITEDFICPLTHDIMVDPVIACDGQTYERVAIERWFNKGNCTSPMTREYLDRFVLIENRALRATIEKSLCHLPNETVASYMQRRHELQITQRAKLQTGRRRSEINSTESLLERRVKVQSTMSNVRANHSASEVEYEHLWCDWTRNLYKHPVKVKYIKTAVGDEASLIDKMMKIPRVQFRTGSLSWIPAVPLKANPPPQPLPESMTRISNEVDPRSLGALVLVPDNFSHHASTLMLVLGDEPQKLSAVLDSADEIADEGEGGRGMHDRRVMSLFLNSDRINRCFLAKAHNSKVVNNPNRRRTKLAFSGADVGLRVVAAPHEASSFILEGIAEPLAHLNGFYTRVENRKIGGRAAYRLQQQKEKRPCSRGGRACVDQEMAVDLSSGLTKRGLEEDEEIWCCFQPDMRTWVIQVSSLIGTPVGYIATKSSSPWEGSASWFYPFRSPPARVKPVVAVRSAVDHQNRPLLTDGTQTQTWKVEAWDSKARCHVLASSRQRMTCSLKNMDVVVQDPEIQRDESLEQLLIELKSQEDMDLMSIGLWLKKDLNLIPENACSIS